MTKVKQKKEPTLCLSSFLERRGFRLKICVVESYGLQDLSFFQPSLPWASLSPTLPTPRVVEDRPRRPDTNFNRLFCTLNHPFRRRKRRRIDVSSLVKGRPAPSQ